MSTLTIDFPAGVFLHDVFTMVMSLVMIRRSYGYISLGFVAIWLLINLSYISKLHTPGGRLVPHLHHDGDEINKLQADLIKTDFTVPPSIAIPEKQKIYVNKNISLTPDELLDIKNWMDRHSFNVSASNAIPLDREVPNFKPSECPGKFSAAFMPKVSVIICFHNEALSTLLRTVYSIVRTTPSELLQQIILIDDASTYDYLGKKLSKALKAFPQVRLIRSPKRLGIARARTKGLMQASGKVLVFLDSHCECAEGWLEPLLLAIMENPKQIVCPEVDIIEHDTFEYTKPDQSYEGSFDWELNMVMKPLSDRQKQLRKTPADPIRSATMLGGLFAVSAKYLRSIGSFDHNMEIWGGENLELSFRIWICGGSIAILPCSRVGHVFRPVIPYGFPNQGAAMTLHRNNQRVAEAWMDGFKKYYYGASRKVRTFNPVLIHSYTSFLRSQLTCEDFYWYLTNIIPELPVPPDNAEYFGQLRQKGACVEMNADKQLVLAKCVQQQMSQTFHMTPEGWVKHNVLCLVYQNTNKHFLSMAECNSQQLSCSFQGPSQFVCDHDTSGSPMCLQSSSISEPVYLHKCETSINPSQIWSFTHHIDLQLMNFHAQ